MRFDLCVCLFSLISSAALWSVQEVYRSMLDTISMRGWDLPGQGDHEWRLEEFVLCKDDRYHRRDAFGYKMPDCTLQIVRPASHLSQRIHQSSDASMPLPSTSASTGSRLDEAQIAEKVGAFGWLDVPCSFICLQYFDIYGVLVAS